MRKNESLVQKLFGMASGLGSGRVPLRSNIVNGSGYGRIGGTGRTQAGRDSSPILGNATPSNKLSGYYNRHDELKSYSLIDLVQLSVGLFVDYIVSFLQSGDTQGIVSIMSEDGTALDQEKTNRMNEILTKDLDIVDYVKGKLKDYTYFGSYSSIIAKTRDELGHLKFRFEELSEPTSVVVKKERSLEDGTMAEKYLVRGDEDKIYEVGEEDVFFLGIPSLRLINDLDGKVNGPNPLMSSNPFAPTSKSSYEFSVDEKDPINRVIEKSSYLAGKPLFYSLILKLKELIVKELLISLINLRDISSTNILLLAMDKSTPLETANDLCAKTTKLANNTNELASFMTANFDVVSFIESTLTKSVKCVPDYNSTMGSRNALLPLDKLSDKIMEMMQTLDMNRAYILNTIGIPSSILDSQMGSKWGILQGSSTLNTKVDAFMTGIDDSVASLVKKIYNTLYTEDIDPSRIKIHITTKTTVEYNNQINMAESMTALTGSLNGVIVNAIQLLDSSSPLVDSKAFLSYIQNLIKDIDPNSAPLITEESVNKYLIYSQAKLRAQAEQMGIDPSIFEDQPQEGNPQM